MLLSLLFLLYNSLYDCSGMFARKQMVRAGRLVFSDTLRKNILDHNNLKQGSWDFVENGVVKGFQTFRNDTLHGPSRYWINYPGQIMEHEFYRGKEHGLRKHIDERGLFMVVKLEMGKVIWTAFPLADSNYPKPVKGMTVSEDSVYVECPYANDTIWYRGLFLNSKPAGVHKMYYPNGKPRFEYDYTASKIKTFDSTGVLISDCSANDN